MDANLNNLLSRLQEINSRKTLELQKIFSDHNLVAVLTEIHERYESTLDTLANFKSATDHCGKQIEIQEVRESCAEEMRKHFRELTGTEFIPEPARSRGE